MNETEVLQHLVDVPMTHIFRTLHPIIQGRREQLRTLIVGTKDEIPSDHLEQAEVIVDTLHDLFYQLMSRSDDDNPYKAFEPKVVDYDLLRKYNSNEYDAIVEHYVTIILPSFLGERYFSYVNFHFLNPLATVSGAVTLLSDLQPDTDPMHEDWLVVVDIFRQELVRFKAIVDAVAAFERQQFGGGEYA